MCDQSITCGYCGVSRPDLQRCSKCHAVHYCGRACQRLDWTDHKLTCRKQDKYENKDKRTDIDNDVKAHDMDKGSCQEETNGDNVTNRGGDVAGSHQGDSNAESVDSGQKPSEKCHVCGLGDCSMKCGRCRGVYYCSKQCQKKAWGQHKTQCLPKKPNTMPGVGTRLTADEQRVIEDMKRRQARFSSSRQQCQSMGMNMNSPEIQLFLNKLAPGQLQIHPRPLGSLASALAFARRAYFYPPYDIIESFSEIPPEFLPFPMSFFVQMRNYVVVAFMFMRHDHVMRHGVYLKDSSDKITHVEFYMDNPWPFFNYSQIKPGNYILLENPVMHRFFDGQIGIRVDDPSTVKIYNPHSSHNVIY